MSIDLLDEVVEEEWTTIEGDVSNEADGAPWIAIGDNKGGVCVKASRGGVEVHPFGSGVAIPWPVRVTCDEDSGLAVVVVECPPGTLVMIGRIKIA